MISQKTQLETKVNEKPFIFQCEPNASLTECFEAISIFRSYIIGRIKEADEQNQTADDPKPE